MQVYYKTIAEEIYLNVHCYLLGSLALIVANAACVSAIVPNRALMTDSASANWRVFSGADPNCFSISPILDVIRKLMAWSLCQLLAYSARSSYICLVIVIQHKPRVFSLRPWPSPAASRRTP